MSRRRGCAPCCAVMLRGEETPAVEYGEMRVDLSATRVTRRGEEVRQTPIEWHVLTVLVLGPGGPGAEHRRVYREPVGRVDGVVAGQSLTLANRQVTARTERWSRAAV